MTLPIDGIVPVIPTPFDENEEIDFPSLARLIDFAVKSGATAICLPAYGSEFYKLSDEERQSLIAAAARCVGGRVPLIAQANHDSAKIAARIAADFVSTGADIISIALPRRFPATDGDLLHYCGAVASAVAVPMLVQDFNPGGPTISADFLCQLHRQHPNVQYAKLEEPLVINKLQAVRDRLGDSFGMLSGWGGLYTLDGLAAGSCGVLPGTAVCDLFTRVWRQERHKAGEGAGLFAHLLPYITFSLQTFELFLWMEKRILHRRGILSHETRRSLTRAIEPPLAARADQIIDQVMTLLA